VKISFPSSCGSCAGEAVVSEVLVAQHVVTVLRFEDVFRSDEDNQNSVSLRHKREVIAEQTSCITSAIIMELQRIFLAPNVFRYILMLTSKIVSSFKQRIFSAPNRYIRMLTSRADRTLDADMVCCDRFDVSPGCARLCGL
jgi:hypothetical protein